MMIKMPQGGAGESVPQSDHHPHMEQVTVFVTNLPVQNQTAVSLNCSSSHAFGNGVLPENLRENYQGMLKPGLDQNKSFLGWLNFPFPLQGSTNLPLFEVWKGTRGTLAGDKRKEAEKLECSSVSAPAGKLRLLEPEDKSLLCVLVKRDINLFAPKDTWVLTFWYFWNQNTSDNHRWPAVVRESSLLVHSHKTCEMALKRTSEVTVSKESGNVTSPIFLMTQRMSLLRRTWTSLILVGKSFVRATVWMWSFINIFTNLLHFFKKENLFFISRFLFTHAQEDICERNRCQHKFKSLTNKNIVKMRRQKKPLCYSCEYISCFLSWT